MGLGAMRQALSELERELAAERRHLLDAERRGRLAADIPDSETVTLAVRFAFKHRERIGVLERKAAAQRDELALAEREVQEMMVQFRAVKRGLGANRSAPGVEAAWQDLESTSGQRPETDSTSDLLKSKLDRDAHEAAAEAQLAYLKKKLRKEHE